MQSAKKFRSSPIIIACRIVFFIAIRFLIYVRIKFSGRKKGIHVVLIFDIQGLFCDMKMLKGIYHDS